MKQADKFELCVSSFTGEAYISTIGKDGCMTENRKKLTEGEVLSFIHQWAETNINDEEDYKIITLDNKPILEIKLLNKQNKDLNNE